MSNLFSDNSIKIKINEITKSWTVHIPFFAYCITNFLILKYFYIDKSMWPLSFQCWHNLKFIHITLSLQISRFSSQFSWYRFHLPKFDCIALPVCISFCGPLHIYNFRYCCHPHLLQLPRLPPDFFFVNSMAAFRKFKTSRCRNRMHTKMNTNGK